MIAAFLAGSLAFFGPAPAAADTALPTITMQLPFPVGQTWQANGPHAFSGRDDGSPRNAVDMGPGGGRNGTVVAAAAGRISRVKDCGGGYDVLIDHADGWQTRYYHLGKITDAVAEGASIGMGDIIGTTAMVCARTTFSHLHFGLFRWGEPVSIDGLVIGGHTIHAKSYNYGGYWIRNSDGVRVAEDTNTAATCCLTSLSVDTSPIGSVDEVSSPAPGRFRVRGWAFDPDAPDTPIDIHVYAGGPPGSEIRSYDLGATTVDRPDVQAAFPGAGPTTGFDATLTVDPGTLPIHVFAINVQRGSDRAFRPVAVTVADPSPLGNLEHAASPAPGQLEVRGWAFDPEAAHDHVGIRILVGGPTGRAVADYAIGRTGIARGDVRSVYPEAGPRTGFHAVIPDVPDGEHDVYAYAVNIGLGEDRLIGTIRTTIDPVPPVVRLSGDDRMTTAIAVSRDRFPGPGSAAAVVLARGDGHADALAGTPLAVAKRGPLLLTTSGALDGRVEAEIARVLPPGRTVYLLGGTAALDPAVADRLGELGYRVVRLAGSDRFRTAVAIAGAIGVPQRIFLATGLDFPDAMAAGAAAASNGGVLLLTAGADMPDATRAHLDAYPDVGRFAVGGRAAAADPDALAVVGSDRYDTARRVAEAFFPAPAVVGIATGERFPDALAGGVHAGLRGAPLLLTPGGSLAEVTAEYLDAASPSTAYLFGGPLALSPAVAAAVESRLE